MKKAAFLTCILLAIILGLSACAAAPTYHPGMTLYLNSNIYARKWHDRYPLGNGTIGVMEKGHARHDEIGLNDASFWSGTGADKYAEHPEGLVEARSLLDAGKVTEAEEIIKEKLLGGYTEGYLPLGTLKVDRKRGGTGYARTLDLTEGVHRVAFGKSEIYSFVSHPAGVYARRERGANTATLSYDCPVNHVVRYDAGGIEVDLTAPSTVVPNYQSDSNPVRYEGEGGMKGVIVIKLVTDGGVQADAKGIKVADYTELTWYLATSTEFSEGENFREKARARANAAAEKGFDALQEEHIADFKPLMERVTLSLNGVSNSPADTLYALKKGASEELIVTLFQFGRYLSLSAQRGDYPSNLQGIWNAEIRPPWSSNYTLNINTEMNLWGADTLNLSECEDNLLPFVERLAARGRVVAEKSFGLGGWTAGHNSDIWAHANPVGAENAANPVSWGYYIGTAGWLCNMLYDHYRFNEDAEYLKRIRPLLSGALEFYMDYATYDVSRGGYILSPSVSPENSYLVGRTWCALSKETAMDAQIVNELTRNYLALSEKLGEDEVTTRAKEFYARLAPTKIGSDGRVLEWGEEKKEAEPTHRHLSHLYAVYPGAYEVSEELERAALASLSVRGDEGTGWSLAWKVGMYARLKDGDHALRILERQLRRSTTLNRKGGSYDSLLGAHPPFQIDSNYGVAAGIAEMLVQSHTDEVKILPALPAKWKSGKVTGLKVRGGKTVDIAWENGKATEVVYHNA